MANISGEEKRIEQGTQIEKGREDEALKLEVEVVGSLDAEGRRAERKREGDFQEPKGVGRHDGNSHGPTTQHSHWQSNTIRGRERGHG
ncbi:predicted protein [Histoplasma mississippiense (nom. inval.)]|uniref:predicted protein n=1 Tax=Ajellomyces capsulatus (strain NAm1 / WU24) TaxID=2059318 RepID=UPI000157CB28|nr:predicted protein [Histoplasma mississippiense (nom. inval.)]EDN09355.1 predicted protein [Histoplasma mississippiense (nom. inval.)]